MGLFKPGWMSKNEERACAAVERLIDPMELMRAALESPWKTAQLAAVARLDSDAALLAVLNASSQWYIHEAIVGRLRGQEALIRYLFSGEYAGAQKIALSHVEDQQALRRFILEYPNDPTVIAMKETAIERVKDDRFLLDLAHGKGNLNAVLQNLAIRHITGEPAARQLYEEIQNGQYKNDSDYCLQSLFEGLDAPEFLMELALSETTAPFTRALAVEQLGNLGEKGSIAQLTTLRNSKLFLGRHPKFFDATLGEVAQNACARLSGKSVFELAAETEDESFLSRQIGLLLRKSDANDGAPYQAMNYIRAFYRAGRFRDRIAKLNGRIVSPHTDRPSEHCVDEHADTAEIVFRL
ncbi:MAG: hypothetical protein GX417_06910 [Clostridiales bacterium]|nr:hypothetical protein [Clostridiales bacterium]